MSNAKTFELPWWYKQEPQKFMSSPDVEMMTCEEIGSYFLLLQKAWLLGENCTLPNDPERLAKLARIGKVSELVLSKFILNKDGRLYNPRLSMEWQAAVKRSKDARKGADGRWKESMPQHSSSNATALPSQSHSNAKTQHKTTQENRTKKPLKTRQAQVSLPTSGEDSPASPSTPTGHGPEPASAPSEAAVRLASSLAQILKRDDLRPATLVAWAEQADTLLAKQHSEQTIAAVMKWALVDSENMFWRGRVYAMKNFRNGFKAMLGQYTRGDQKRGSAADPLASRAASLKTGHDFSAIAKGDI